MDAVSAGNKSPWQKYFADDCMYFDEKGRSMNKAALLADVSPLPLGYSGSIKLVKAQSHITRDTAILSYDLDESETIFGQSMTARYHGTDTWLLRDGQWQIVAGQMLRYYEDPAPGKANHKNISRLHRHLPIGSRECAKILQPRETISTSSVATVPKLFLLRNRQMSFFAKGLRGACSSVGRKTGRSTPSLTAEITKTSCGRNCPTPNVRASRPDD